MIICQQLFNHKNDSNELLYSAKLCVRNCKSQRTKPFINYTVPIIGCISLGLIIKSIVFPFKACCVEFAIKISVFEIKHSLKTQRGPRLILKLEVKELVD